MNIMMTIDRLCSTAAGKTQLGVRLPVITGCVLKKEIGKKGISFKLTTVVLSTPSNEHH